MSIAAQARGESRPDEPARARDEHVHRGLRFADRLADIVAWPDDIDEVITGDLTAALAYCTPAGCAVVNAVAPIGLRDRERGTVGFTTSLGFGRKLERIRRNPRVALAYHAREHGFSRATDFVLVQGKATPEAEPDRDFLDDVIVPAAERFMGPPKRGKLFWDRWLQEYYSDRVPVTVAVERIVAWSNADASGEPRVFGTPLPADPPSQEPPGGGTGPRLDPVKAARRFGSLPNQLLGLVGGDGYPDVRPVEAGMGEAGGIPITAARPLPSGARRASLLAHRYNARLIGLETRGYTGWMSVGDDRARALFAPHTTYGFRAPANKTLLLLANGLLAKRGLRKARRAAAPA